MMKLSEKGSQQGTNVSILSARDILKELDKRSKSFGSDDSKNEKTSKQKKPLKK